MGAAGAVRVRAGVRAGRVAPSAAASTPPGSPQRARPPQRPPYPHPASSLPPQYYGALPSHIFDREKHCGKCVRIKGAEKDAPDGWTIVKIVDEVRGGCSMLAASLLACRLPACVPPALL